MTNATAITGGWTFNRNLGSGGFGVVELWVHNPSGEKLAIKRCKWDSSQVTQTQKKRWVHEVEVMRGLEHPNIVRAVPVPFKFPSEDSLSVLCMEYCRNGDLRKVLNETENCCGISEEEALRVIDNISSAVEYLHCHKITHRDLKPENIVLQDANGVVSYKLIDLGYAKELGEASAMASIVGTLNYVAPELLWKGTYSCSVDYWSLGILFYEILTGNRPFLSRMHYNKTWMQHVKSKAYEDICAYEVDGQVVFKKEIEGPTHLSSCKKDKLVEWFRVVLQWDPNNRGRVRDASGRSEIVVFNLLREILSKKVIYVFSASLYKFDAYEIGKYDTVMGLQKAIEKNTGIAADRQILTDYHGRIIDKNMDPFLPYVQHTTFFVFETGSISVKNVSPPNMSLNVQKLIEKSRNQIDCDTLKDYYRATIFFMKYEVHVFQLFIFALSIKVDLINMQMNAFAANMEKALLNTKLLVTEVHSDCSLLNDESTENNMHTSLQSTHAKVTTMVTAADQIKNEFQSLTKDYTQLRYTMEQNNPVSDLTIPYNEACNVYESVIKQVGRKTVWPKDMVKQIYKFLSIREKLLSSENISVITSQSMKIEEKLAKLERSFNSVIAMTAIYREELRNILSFSEDASCGQSSSFTNLNKPSNTDNNVIYDNLVLRYTLDNLIQQIEKQYMEMLNLAP